MSAECYPMSVLPHVSRLYEDYLGMAELSADAPIRRWYGAEHSANAWMEGKARLAHAAELADALELQATDFGAGKAVFANIAKLREGARAVVTGQQVGLFGGPLLTLLKAATAVARASEATKATGVSHVPIFWLATEDHDLQEVDQVSLPGKQAVEKLRLGLLDRGAEVGGLRLGPAVEPLLEQMDALLGYAPICDLLRACYTSESTFAEAFGRLLTQLFAAHGLIVMDASGRRFHALGAKTLRAALERAPELEAVLLARTAELIAMGYHAQVLVKSGSSLLFLVSDDSGPDGIRQRLSLRRSMDGSWRAGGRSYSIEELLEILQREPERLSPNALLRPVFQDTILPTVAYVGGPAEVAYFAQSAVLFKAILGKITPVLPRFSATLISPPVAKLMALDALTLRDVFDARTAEVLAQRLGARAMPVEEKRRLAAAGNALNDELTALTTYFAARDVSLGRSAKVSASKMRYQMNRLRRLAATFELQKEATLAKRAGAVMLNLFPGQHPQERVLAGVAFLQGNEESLIDQLVSEATTMCVGHTVVRL